MSMSIWKLSFYYLYFSSFLILSFLLPCDAKPRLFVERGHYYINFWGCSLYHVCLVLFLCWFFQSLQELLPRPLGLNTVALLRAASNALNLGPKQTMKLAEEHWGKIPGKKHIELFHDITFFFGKGDGGH